MSVPAPPPRPDLPPRWPLDVRAELERRHTGAMAAATRHGPRVLDLSLPEPRNQVRTALAHGVADDAQGRYDAVVSVAGLARFADLFAAVTVVADLLAPGGMLFAVEPGYRPGALSVMAASLGALLPPARGVHLARDLPATLRAAQFTVTQTERFTMSTPVWPLRPFVELAAQRPDTPGGGR